ncbi:hypothetical protein N752_00980 [Desulforamulus aquiferis]|nr:hypothetical protein N752_00980 [Desulforamulus aquiferis]
MEVAAGGKLYNLGGKRAKDVNSSGSVRSISTAQAYQSIRGGK